MTDLERLIRVLTQARVEFIIGGVAATAHGSARLTEDLDLVCQRTPDNIARLVAALTPYKPYLGHEPTCEWGQTLKGHEWGTSGVKP
ncbi:MAG: hypothetical protein FJ279_10130 [Planctomycetes bacterium]|nr:hypothetical protein [Planctomycetota bacterium]